MLRKTDTNKSGFTIIEVVITIAIGAAVMALVLNAVAGARRSQRNNARTSDVNRVVAAANQYIATRNKLPEQWSDISTNVDPGTFGHYDTTPVKAAGYDGTEPAGAGHFLTSESGSTAPPVSIDIGTTGTQRLADLQGATPAGIGRDQADSYDQFHLILKAKCNADKTEVAPAGIREMVIVYRLEGQALSCQTI